LTHLVGTIARARQDGITHAILDEIDALLWTHSRHTFVLPTDLRVPYAIDTLQQEYIRSLDRLTLRLDGEFLAGTGMTIAYNHCDPLPEFGPRHRVSSGARSVESLFQSQTGAPSLSTGLGQGQTVLR